MNRPSLPACGSPHLSSEEVREMVEALPHLEGEARQEVITQLAWRPAWAIRSRRGSLQMLRQIFRRGVKRQA